MQRDDEAGTGERAPAVSPFIAGLTASCPKCGNGPLFRSGLILRDSCGACGQSFAAADPGDGPAVFAIFILGFVILAGALLLEFRIGPPVWVHVLAWGVLTPVLAFFLLRVLKATLIALQFKHKAEEGRLTLTK
ncbi:MAG: DUF983 domain-containing protein [Hyphomicrobiaceae bacterium]|nr:DUF983 domain-containing protein [Hyphomicrobiaceae bacterium]